MNQNNFDIFVKKSMEQSGVKSTLEILTMKSLFIEMFYDEILLSTGTAFLVANDPQSHCALITNRHNVTGRNQDTNECLDKMCATPNAIVVHFHKADSIGEWKKIKLPLYRDNDSPFWIEDPILGEKADVVALNIKWGNDVTRLPFYMKNGLDRDNLYVGPADTVSVIGFPFGISSFGKFPVWATGFMAQELLLMTSENPVFLIDCRARQGQSGSPVIAYRSGGYRQHDGNKINAVLSGTPKWEFLGIYSGRVNSESDLGRVWHVSIIERILKAAEKDYHHRLAQNNEAE